MNWETNEVELIILNDESLYNDIIINNASVLDIVYSLKDIMFSHVDLNKVDFEELNTSLNEVKEEEAV